MRLPRSLARRSITLGAFIAALVVVGSGVALAAIPRNVNGTMTIDACYKANGGQLRVVDVVKGEECSAAERPLQWAQQSGGLSLDSVVGGQGGVVKDGTIDQFDLAEDSVGASELAPGAVAWNDLAGIPVGLADGIVDGGDDRQVQNQIKDDTVTTADIHDGTVIKADLGAGLVGELSDLRADVDATASRLEGLSTPGGVTDYSKRVHTTNLSGVTNATISVDALPVPAATRLAVQIPIAGISVGDFVSVSPPSLLDDDLIFAGARVDVNGVLTIFLYNPTGAAIDDGANTWTVQWIDLTP